jgi:glycosyltransferase 2 family protein
MIKTIFKILLSVSFLAYIFFKVDCKELLGTLSVVDPWKYILALSIHAITIYLCCVRWKVILDALAVYKKTAKLLMIYFRGFFVQLFLPSTLGVDVYRIMSIGKSSKNYSAAVSSILLERFIGFIDLTLLSLIPLLFISQKILGAKVVICFEIFFLFLAISVLVLAFVYSRLTISNSQVGKTLDLLPNILKKIINKIRETINKISNALKQIVFSWKLLWKIIFLMVLIRTSWVTSWYIIGTSVGIELSFAHFCVLIPLVELCRMLPVSISGLGISEYASLLILTEYGVPDSSAVLLTILIFSFQLIRASVGWISWHNRPKDLNL